MKRFALLAAALLVSACGGDKSSTSVGNDSPSDPSQETFATVLGINIGAMHKTALGTYYKDLTTGAGAAMSAPTATTSVNVDYTGWLKDAEQFDQGTGVGFTLGGVVPGFADGMAGMNVGGQRLIVIPSALGYGPGGSPPRIPGNATIVFQVRLNSFK